MPVSRPGDPSEKEAQTLSTRIAAATNPARIALLPASPPAASPVRKAAAGSGGTMLPPALARSMGAAMAADLSGVRIHADAAAAQRAAAMGARAVTVGGDIYFGAGQYRPETAEGRTLIAHELVHTVQNLPIAQASLLDSAAGWVADKAGGALAAVAARARAFFASRAQSLGGYRLFTMAIGHDPIADTPVNASGADVLRAIVGLVPLGDKIVAALDNHGIFDKGAAFLSRQFGALKAMAGAIAGNVRRFIAGLDLDALGRLGSLWDEAKTLVVGSIREVINFLGGFAADFAALVKETILKPLGAWAAANIPHWKLLTGVLGNNPVSAEGESPAMALIGAFMALIGQEEIWNNIQKSGAGPRAWAWFQGAMAGARALVTSIPGRVIGICRGLTIADLLTIPQVFARILGEFASFAGSFMSWAGTTVLNLLEIILSVVAPGAVPYLKKAGGAFATIIRNPIGFVGNLVQAGKLGFMNFAGNFLGHLKAALVGWLTGSLGGSGVYIPRGFSGREILKFVASVLGLTWAQIRVRLVAAVGETAVKAMETGFALVKTLVTEGPAAAWQQILAAVGDLKAMAIDAIMDFVKSRIVTAAVTKLVSMLNPAGAFIQALIAIYNTIMFFVERLSQIAQVAMSFIDSIAAIAGGALGAAAARVERTLAGLLVLVISFLARLAGLGRVSDAIIGLINKIRAPIMRAIDKLIGFLVAQARRFAAGVRSAISGSDTRTPADKQRDLDKAVRELRPKVAPLMKKGVRRPLLMARLAMWKHQYRLTALAIEGGTVKATINPTASMYTAQEVAIGAALEPILARAEAAFLSRTASGRVAAAETAIAAGQPAPVKLSQAEIVTVLRNLRQGRATAAMTQTPRQKYPRQQIATAATQGYDLQVSARPIPGVEQRPDELASMQNIYVPDVGRYMYSRDETHPYVIPAMPPGGRGRPLPVKVAATAGENVAAIRGLRDEVEVARSVANLPANKVAQALVAMGEAKEGEITFGRMAGMATGYSAAAGSFGPTGSATPRQIQSATQVRQGSYAVIFQRLRAALAKPDSKLLTDPANAQLRDVAEAFDKWMKASFDRLVQPADDSEARRLGDELAAKVAAFLQSQGGTG